MRARSMVVLFGGVLAGLGTMGGSPCGGQCLDTPAHTSAVAVTCVDLTYARATVADAGFSIADGASDGAAVLLEGDAALTSSSLADGGVVPSTGDTISLPVAACNYVCRGTVTACRVRAGDPREVPVGQGCACCFVVDCDYVTEPGHCGGGRRTEGVELARAPRVGPLGDYFAACASLEAASVRSFRRLRDELRAHGAPRSLLRACSRAARDESRHARALGSLARRHGAQVPPNREALRIPRSVEAIAIENAREGCVFETFGALLATWQSARVRSPVVRGVMRRLARDEARHASLAWDMARWLDARLDRAARTRVRNERRRASVILVESLRAAPAHELVESGLLPPAETGVAMARALMSALDA